MKRKDIKNMFGSYQHAINTMNKLNYGISLTTMNTWCDVPEKWQARLIEGARKLLSDFEKLD